MAAGFGPIAGLKIGHAQDLRALTGCTVLLLDPAGAPESAKAGMVAACEIRGGAVGARELEALRPGHLVERIHALVFAGGSAFGLEAAAGVMRWCEERGIGFDTGPARKGAKERIRVPIVPAAILYDLRIGELSRAFGSTARPRHPDAAMGYDAAEAAARARSDAGVAEGTVGAGTGATVGKLFGIERATKAGIGCWTEEIHSGRGVRHEPCRVAALAAVNAFGDIRDPDTGRVVAGARAERGKQKYVGTAEAMRRGTVRRDFADRFTVDANTVLVAVGTNAALNRLEAQRLAIMAAAGMARVISPAHSTFDGDAVFALSVGDARADINALGAAAAEAVARAIVRGVTQARSAGGVADARS